MEILGIIFEPGDPVFTDNLLTLRLESQVSFFHNGDGGVVNYDISNGKVAGSDPPNSLLADAGTDQTVNANKKGTARVSLDGSGSSGPIDSYSWSWLEDGQLRQASGLNPTVTLAVGTPLITLVVSDSAGNPLTDKDQVIITVKSKSTGGGGGGGPGGGGGGPGGGGGNCGKKNKPPCPS
jgi:hypothetical protein